MRQNSHFPTTLRVTVFCIKIIPSGLVKNFFWVTRINYANELLNMAAERCKYATFLQRCSEKTTGSNVFKIGGNNTLRLCLLHETHFKRIYAKK